MIWWTSDPHFWHRNVIPYCNRPFSSVEEMNEALIANWNAVVAEDDDVYILGDFAFCGITKLKEILARLKGRKHLILGNHDDHRVERMLKAGFTTVQESATFYWSGRKFNLSHYPYAPTKREEFIHKLKNFWKFWRRKKYSMLRYMDRRLPNDGRWLLHGHVHTAWMVRRNQLNVGVDVHGYRPVSMLEIVAIISGVENGRKY